MEEYIYNVFYALANQNRREIIDWPDLLEVSWLDMLTLEGK